MEANNIPLSRIRPNPKNPRNIIKQTMIDALSASIQAVGLKNPLKVVALPNGDYLLISGHIRLAALQKLGWAEVPAFVLDLTPEQALVEAILDNRGQQMSWFDLYLAVESMQQLVPKPTQQEIGDRLEIDRSTVSRAGKILGLLNTHSRKLICENLTKTEGYEVSENAVFRLTDLADPEKIEKALKAVIKHELTEPQTKKLVNWVKAGKKPEDFKIEKGPKNKPIEPAWKPVKTEDSNLPLTKIPLNRVRVLREMEFSYHPIHIERHTERIKEGPVITAVPIILKARPLSEAEKAADPGHDYELYAGILHFQGLERAGVGEAEAYIHEGIERWEALGLAFAQNLSNVLPWVEVYAILEDRIRERPGEPPEKLAVELWERPEEAKKVLEVMKLLNEEAREVIWDNMYGCLEGWADPNEYGFTQMLARQLIRLEKADPDPEKVKKLVKKTIETAIEYKVEYNELGQVVSFVLAGNDPEDFFVEEA